MILRKMIEEDIPQVETIEQALFSDAWSGQGFAETLDSPHAIALVAEETVTYPSGIEKKRILGYLVMYVSFEEGEISKVAVKKETQHKGVGSLLMQAMLEQGIEQGVTRYVLEVRSSNETAIALYQKYNFKQIGIRRGFYEKPREDAVIMIREEETGQC